MYKRKTKAILVLILTLSVFSSACGNTKNNTDTQPDTRVEETQEFTITEESTIAEQSEIPEEYQALPERLGGKLYVGDEFTFGTYEQDNNLENGAEDIEWIVLEKRGDNSYLCISKYVLDAQHFVVYSDNNKPSDWEKMGKVSSDWGNSDVRVWLNNDFYNTAFTAEDKNYIVDTTNQVYLWASYDAEKMSLVKYTDKVCLINWNQLEEFPGCVKVTEYAKTQGAPFIDDGTREHENCSDGWCMMSVDVDRNKEWIEIKNSREYSDGFVVGARDTTLGVAEYKHDYLSLFSTYDYTVRSDYNSSKYKSGVRPVITITLEE